MLVPEGKKVDFFPPRFQDFSKNDVEYDEKFRQKCVKYGASWDVFKAFGTLTPFFYVLNTIDPNIEAILDTNFNTVAIIHNGEPIELGKSYKSYLCSLYDDYETLKKPLPYPFDKVSLGQIVELSSRTEIITPDCGRTFKLKVNGQVVEDDEKSPYYEMLVFIKAMGELIENYFAEIFKSKMLDYNIPDIHDYMKRIIWKTKEYVNIKILNPRWTSYTIPVSSELQEYLGVTHPIPSYKHVPKAEQKINETRHHVEWWMFHAPCDLLSKDNGYVIGHDEKGYNALLKWDGERPDLSKIAEELTSLLATPRIHTTAYEKPKKKNYGNINLEEYVASHTEKPKQDFMSLILEQKSEE